MQENFHVKSLVFYIGLCVYLWNSAFINMNLKQNLINFRDVCHKFYYYNIQIIGKRITIIVIYVQYKDIVGLIVNIFQ
jgi:hypothetical protein